MNVENLNKLIAHLEAQPPERFDICAYFSDRGDKMRGSRDDMLAHKCGTAACIAGHIFVLNPAMNIWSGGASRWIGISYWDGKKLFEPEGFATSDDYTLERAIATLKRLRDTYLATGQVVVDWGPEPGEERKTPWTAPQAVEVIAPALPAEITSLLRPSLVKTEA